ncbi:MAG: hypothetical protein J6V90_12745 [Treponema sp.]|nr:hypothetical protein [Treponema sp.]
MNGKLKLEELLNNVFFTEKDDSISGTSQRDPLGLQPIWSFYGRRVINHLTTISTSIHGFREVLLCLAICKEIYVEKSRFSYADLILFFEQLFIYTSISKGRIEGILGSDNGNAKFIANNSNPELSSTKTVLVREISLGYYGRYKTPLSTMGIIDGRSELQIDIADIKKLYGEEPFCEIQKAFKKFIESNNKQFNSFEAKDALFEAILGKFRQGERKFWINKLYEDKGEKKELMELCYEQVNKESIAQQLFNSLSSKEEVTDILRLEPYLRCLEHIFYKAMSSKKVNEIEIENIVVHKKSYKNFCQINTLSTTPLFRERIKFLREKCNPDSANYIENVIKYHELVCKQKKSSVWIEMDTEGRLQPYVNTNDVDIDISVWGRDYYLSSLKSIKSEIQEFSK